MRRLSVAALVGVIFLAVLTPVAPVGAATDTSYTTDITVGASRTLPTGSFGFSDGCQVGYDGATEYRCAFEFDISIPSTAKITAATIDIQKVAGCGTSDCPVDVFGYNGNGSSDLGDVSQGSLARIFTPTSSVMHLDVSADLQARVSNGLDWAGYRLTRNATSPHNPDVQDFSIAGTNRVRLSVSYVAQPVDVTVHLGGLGDGFVTSNPSGISCGDQLCTSTFEYAEPVTLTATPQNGGTFNHWEGGECDGSTNPVCAFNVPALNMDTTAIFDPIGTPISPPPPSAAHSNPPITPKPTTGATVKPGPSGVAPSASAASGNPTPAPSGSPSGSGSASASDAATAQPTSATGEATPAASTPPGAPASSSSDQSLGLILVIILVAAVAGGGGYFLAGRRRKAA